jgi:phage FluMu gp28-like protein
MQIHQKLGLGTAPPESESSLRVELANGSRIVALPGREETVRGYSSVALLVIDEAARVSDDLYRAVRPMLAVSGGRIVALSTPFGKRGFFHQEWTSGEGWERVRITAAECPRIPAEFLEQERRAMPAAWFQQEYFCEFSEAEGAVFSYADVMAALSGDVKPLFLDEGTAAGVISGDVKPLCM